MLFDAANTSVFLNAHFLDSMVRKMENVDHIHMYILDRYRSTSMYKI